MPIKNFLRALCFAFPFAKPPHQVLSLILASTGAIPASMMHDPVVITCSHVDDEEAAGGSGKNVKNQLKPSDKKLSSKKSSKLHDSNREGGGSKSRGGHANAEKAVGMDYLKVEAVNEDTLEKEVMQKILRWVIILFEIFFFMAILMVLHFFQ